MMGDAMVQQLVARTVRVTPSKQKQHNESAVQTSSKPFIPRNPALRSQHLKSVFPGGFNLAKFRTHLSRQLAEVAPESVASTTTEYEEYKGPDPSEYQVDPATLDWLRPVDVDYTPGSFEECEVTVQVVRPTEHVLQLPQPTFEPEASLHRFRPSAVFEAIDKPAREAQVSEPTPRSRTHSNAVLHLPSVYANDSTPALHVAEEEDTGPEECTDDECVDVTAFVADEQTQGLPQLLGSINVKRRTSHSELHAELSRMLAGVGVRGAAMIGDDALFLRDPSSRTWKPVPDATTVELRGSGPLEILYSCRNVTEPSPRQQPRQQRPELPASLRKTSGWSSARTQLLNSLVHIEQRGLLQPKSAIQATKPTKQSPTSPTWRQCSPNHSVRSPFVPFLPPSPSDEQRQQQQQREDCPGATATRSWSSASRAKRQAMREKQRKMACKLQDRLRHTTLADASLCEKLQDGASEYTQQSSTRHYLEMLFQT